MHRSTDMPNAEDVSFFRTSVTWEGVQTVDEWLQSQPAHSWKEEFQENGVLKLNSLLNEEELNKYRDLYDRMLSGEIDTTAHRHDLGNHEEKKTSAENICQIMWPSVYVAGLQQGPLHHRGLAVAKIILGEDMSFDFDMLLSKGPYTDTMTPWHQDESYWPELPDTRAVSIWVAMDETVPENGCMWFGPGSHKLPLRVHRNVRPGVHVLMCDGSEKEGRPYPLKPGGATCHSGQTMHYSRGNTTDMCRRAFVANYRPGDMVTLERQKGFDHGKKGLDNVINKGKTHESV